MQTVKGVGWGEIDPVTSEKFYPIHDAQRDVLDSPARFTAAIAGTGGGKTVLGPLWLVKQIAKSLEKNEYFLGMVVAPTYKVLSRATVPCLVETLKDTHLEGRWYESRNVYELPDNLGRIWCQGADNPGGLEGGQFSAVWIDEGGQCKFPVWVAVQGRTGAKMAPVLITTTPYGKNWLYSEFFKRFQAGDKDYYVRQWGSFQNPAYPQEEYERAKRTMTPEKAAMRYDGQFSTIEGLVYPNIADCFVEASPLEVISGNGRFYGGIDFGWNDPFAAICGFLDSDDCLWVFYERYKSETPIEDHASNLPKFAHKTIKWFADHEPEYIRKLQKGGHKVKKANKAIIAGIDAVNRRIYTGKIKILVNRCPALRAEAETYCYPADDDENIVGDKPEGGDDHALDALRYMVSGIDIKKAA